MFGWLQFIVAWVVMSNMVHGITYDISELCEPDDSHGRIYTRQRRQATSRMYGKSIDIKTGDPLVVTVGNVPSNNLLQQLVSQKTIAPPSNFSRGAPSQVMSLRQGIKMNQPLDCRFTIKPLGIGSNVTLYMEWWSMDDINCTNFVQLIHGADMLLIRMKNRGTQSISNSVYFPLHVRISLCNQSPSALIVIITVSDTLADYTTSLMAFLTPCGALLVFLTAVFLACCCCANNSCRKRPNVPLETSSTAVTPTPESTDRSEGRPPTYDELFPSTVSVQLVKSGKETPPPTYDKLNLDRPNNVT